MWSLFGFTCLVLCYLIPSSFWFSDVGISSSLKVMYCMVNCLLDGVWLFVQLNMHPGIMQPHQKSSQQIFSPRLCSSLWICPVIKPLKFRCIFLCRFSEVLIPTRKLCHICFSCSNDVKPLSHLILRRNCGF